MPIIGTPHPFPGLDPSGKASKQSKFTFSIKDAYSTKIGKFGTFITGKNFEIQPKAGPNGGMIIQLVDTTLVAGAKTHLDEAYLETFDIRAGADGYRRTTPGIIEGFDAKKEAGFRRGGISVKILKELKGSVNVRPIEANDWHFISWNRFPNGAGSMTRHVAAAYFDGMSAKDVEKLGFEVDPNSPAGDRPILRLKNNERKLSFAKLFSKIFKAKSLGNFDPPGVGDSNFDRWNLSIEWNANGVVKKEKDPC